MTKNLDLNLNTLNESQLERIPAIGREHAKDIISYRLRYGPFKSWDDLKKVHGLTTNMIDDLKLSGVSVGQGEGA